MNAATRDGIESQDIPTRVADLWFPDHGLVLQAGNRLFRVSGGILAARFPVFKDMLSFPQPEDPPLMEGCPIVVLHDSPADAEYFLKAIFDSIFFERPPAPTTFSVVAGVLRLSTKYDVNYLRRRALLHLSSAMPCLCAEYDTVASTRTFYTPGSQFSRLLLIQDLGLTWALPAAMYSVACASVEALVDGISFEGTQVHLPPPIQRTCLIARADLAVSQHHEILRFARSCPDGCDAHLCLQTRQAVLDDLTKGSEVGPLTRVHRATWQTLKSGLCHFCYLEAKTQHRISIQKIWDDIPKCRRVGAR
ncbi:hypothetical protein B0H17DRAFT_1262024 [Mycena rosella]|uniref:BTB domain-containing protein n=1 Tax=Mycena rosella TaxID=1033263 RepID=A0AAD7DS71_MYCRO|nr:hypothetical protein B0H17DRAFT_1262024 [Mycena rosella]